MLIGSLELRLEHLEMLQQQLVGHAAAFSGHHGNVLGLWLTCWSRTVPTCDVSESVETEAAAAGKKLNAEVNTWIKIDRDVVVVVVLIFKLWQMLHGPNVNALTLCFRLAASSSSSSSFYHCARTLFVTITWGDRNKDVPVYSGFKRSNFKNNNN